MKKFFTLVCAVLGISATMYGASADLSEYLTTDEGSTGTSSSFKITTNEDGTLTFSGSYTDVSAIDDSDGSYSVSFDIAAEANGGDTYTVTMSNFEIEGSLSSAFGENSENVTASATGITSIVVSAGFFDGLIGSLPIEITGKGNGTKTVDISDYLNLLDLLGGDLSSFASAVTVTMTCTSDAKLAISVDNDETITCAFAVATDDDGNSTLSFSADGLENIFDELTVEGNIKKVEANGADITNIVIEDDNDQATESTTPGSTLEDIDILPNFTNDWASAATYDATTNTVTWVSPGGYDGDGAWFGDVDYTGYAGISVTFTIESADYFQLVIEYTNGTDKSVVVKNIEAGENTLFTPFDAAGITAVMQCYLQSGTVAQTIIVTEAKIVVTAPSPTAIASVASAVEATEVARYNLMGQKISGAEKGINIIVYSDGSAKKVLVK